MTPFPAILILQHSWIYVGSSNCSYKASYIKSSIDDFFCIRTALRVPNIDPDNGHVRFKKDLDDTGFGGKDNVIEYVIALKDAFNIMGRNTRVCNLTIVWNAYDFEIGLRLWKSGERNLFHISRERVFDIFFDLL